MNVVIVTGMSGAGKTTALHGLEDAGYLAIDNVPPVLWPSLADHVQSAGITLLAIAIDVRGERFLDEVAPALATMRSGGYAPQMVYLDAPTETLVRRFSFTRRTHPLQRGALSEDLASERSMLAPLRSLADLVIDTSMLSAKDLRSRMQRLSGDDRFRLRIVSFGYKRGLPTDVDAILDVRGMRNPYYDEGLRPLPGTHAAVQGYVFADGGLDAYTRLRETSRELAEAARATGRGAYAIAIGCTGGQHRSVAVSERMIHDLADAFDVSVVHRDLAAALDEYAGHDAEDVAPSAAPEEDSEELEG